MCLYFTFTEALYSYLHEYGVLKDFDHSNKSEEQIYQEVFEASYLTLVYSDNKYEAYEAAHKRLRYLDDVIGRGYKGLNKLHQDMQQQKLENDLNHNKCTGYNIDGTPCVCCGSIVFQNCESLHSNNHLDVFLNDDKAILNHFQEKTVTLNEIFSIKEKHTVFKSDQIKNVNSWESESEA